MNLDAPVLHRLRDRLLAEAAKDDAAEAMRHEPSEPLCNAAAERVAPFAEVLFLMMVADDESADPERVAITGPVRVSTDGILSRGEAEQMLADFAARLA